MFPRAEINLLRNSQEALKWEDKKLLVNVSFMYINICIYRYRQWKGDCVFMHAYFFALGSNTSKKKKIFSGNNLSSGTRYYSHFFKEHFLHLISQETFPPKLSSSAERRSEQRKRCMFLCCWTRHPSLVEASRMAGISQGAAAQEEGCCDFMALPEVLSKHFTDYWTAPSAIPKK